MATTKEFQKVPDFFVSKSDIKPVNTNPRYPNFFQTHFTAGDIDQFETYRDRSNGLNPSKSKRSNAPSTPSNVESSAINLRRLGSPVNSSVRANIFSSPKLLA